VSLQRLRPPPHGEALSSSGKTSSPGRTSAQRCGSTRSASQRRQVLAGDVAARWVGFEDYKSTGTTACGAPPWSTHNAHGLASQVRAAATFA